MRSKAMQGHDFGIKLRTSALDIPQSNARTIRQHYAPLLSHRSAEPAAPPGITGP